MYIHHVLREQDQQIHRTEALTEVYWNQTEASRILGPKFQPRIHKQPSRVFQKMWIHAVQGG